jgi:hypothetical protein
MNSIVFGYKELVSAPQTVQLYTIVISVGLLAEQFTVDAEEEEKKEKSLTRWSRVVLEKLTVP